MKQANLKLENKKFYLNGVELKFNKLVGKIDYGWVAIDSFFTKLGNTRDIWLAYAILKTLKIDTDFNGYFSLMYLKEFRRAKDMEMQLPIKDFKDFVRNKKRKMRLNG